MTLDKNVSSSEASWRSSVQTLTSCCTHCQIRRASRTRLHTNAQKTDYAIPPTWNLASRLAKHGCPTIWQCLVLTQLLCRWRHQSGKFWIHPRTSWQQAQFDLWTKVQYSPLPSLLKWALHANNVYECCNYPIEKKTGDLHYKNQSVRVV